MKGEGLGRSVGVGSGAVSDPHKVQYSVMAREGGAGKGGGAGVNVHLGVRG